MDLGATYKSRYGFRGEEKMRSRLLLAAYLAAGLTRGSVRVIDKLKKPF